MAITRTQFYAEITAEVVYKDEEGQIAKDHIDETIPNCLTREKAAIILEKMYKGKLVSILTFEVTQEVRKMSDDDFARYSKVMRRTTLTEEEAATKAENRRKNK